MARVLVVDDSGTDRLIAERLLSAEADLTVEAVSDGATALERLEADPPDLVLTDLVMPGMDGLEVVATIRAEFPGLPVVLMTSQGSEETAVKALRAGAASYVPKRNLASSLADTVHDVLDIAGAQRAEKHIMSTLRRSESTFRMESHQELVLPLVKQLTETAALMGLCDSAENMQIGVALCEALNNAIEHGNLEISSETREADIAAHRALIRERLATAPYRDRRVHVEASLDHREVRFVVRDEGPGFDPAILPDPRDPANLDRATGRGVMLIRSFMDEVVYNERGNEVTMVKRCAEG